MIFTLPNAISLVRIALVPVFLWLLFGRDDPASAGVLIVVVGGTDWVDGYLARRLHQVSEVGKVLDPVADRLAVAAAVIGGWIAGVLPPWFAAAIIAREILVGIGAGVLAARAKARLDVRWFGKVATFALYFAIPAFYVYEGGWPESFRWFAWGIGVPGLILYWYVALLYIGDMRVALRRERAGVSSAGTDPGEAT
ncbi:MAG: CDP-alcohol phosphatidyltransferase family protein [Acidimicrobiia bacterium]|nr:CDP-alcohol phosphatidyltransferase family protein [Acidimicrobiia bacterium]